MSNFDLSGEAIRSIADQIVRDVSANAYLWHTFKPVIFIPAGRGWAANDETIAYVVDHLSAMGGAFTLLELGSGGSTAWFALAAQKWDGRVVSLEHDPVYKVRTATLLKRLGVDELVELIDAPLVASAESPPWYSIRNVPASRVDVLFVDGPPGNMGRHARRPAFGAFREWLSPDAIVVLDDTIRQDEAEVAQLWLAESNGRLAIREKLGGATVMTYLGGEEV